MTATDWPERLIDSLSAHPDVRAFVHVAEIDAERHIGAYSATARHRLAALLRAWLVPCPTSRSDEAFDDLADRVLVRLSLPYVSSEAL